MFEVLNKVCEAADIQIEYSWTPMYNSYYIEGINHLYEFDVGPESGWMYKVDEWFPNYGCSAYKLQDGQDIVWCYTCNGLRRGRGRSLDGVKEGHTVTPLLRRFFGSNSFCTTAAHRMSRHVFDGAITRGGRHSSL